ncbi:hypothetical protein [Mycobacterium sp. E1747]|uniref:hypothetical protein n=1 Tax=Mycobacterium sp. E1747 TaxID=1834128 RepID=UPI0007FCE61F|nr:hypothetical protein [Mycobacterium sp. E1747]OBH04520.1 hypothetical protein A5695_08785 [Mycobacterium sp. E1747]
MLIDLGFVALALGIILVALGYTIESRCVRPGWAAIILAIVLIFIGAVLPRITGPHDYYDNTAEAIQYSWIGG